MHTAMILAGGRGERLRPITDMRPKPLCLVHGIPLIEYHVRHLAAAGFKRVVINHAYKGGQIRNHLGNGARFNIEICYTPEPCGALETGGGIFNALPLLGPEPFLTVNADVYTDYNFMTLKLPETSQVHLVLVKKPMYHLTGDFGLNENHILENTNRNYTFAGIACYHPDFFAACKPGRYSVTPILRAAADQHLASGELYMGKWIDIGDPRRLALANQE